MFRLFLMKIKLYEEIGSICFKIVRIFFYLTFLKNILIIIHIHCAYILTNIYKIHSLMFT